MNPAENRLEPAPPSREVRCRLYDGASHNPALANLAVETALEIVVNDRPHSMLMQTPGFERELVLGFLFTEGLIEKAADVAGLELESRESFLESEGIRAHVRLPGLDVSQGLPPRPALSLSSCGLCGKESLDKLGRGTTTVKSKQKFAWNGLAALMGDLRGHQPLYEVTRGVHAVALHAADGSFFCCYEDVGRHNALDKVIGRSLIEKWTFGDKLVILSGRASLEMVLKTARAGIPLLLCFSNPTVSAVEAAKALNLTLVGRRGEDRLTCYTHFRRLVDPAEATTLGQAE
ncbi:MAG: formate dehydrogenase accessory sulfurtransferase FdhD [Pseudomonadota bacterium]